MEQRITRWLSDGDTWVGVFRNHDLGHPDIGRKVGIPFSLSDGSFDKAQIGKDRAPDMRQIGMGWRYLLEAKCKTLEETLAAMKED